MDRGEKKGVRQGRPVRRASDIIREADRIIKEQILKSFSPLLTNCCCGG